MPTWRGRTRTTHFKTDGKVDFKKSTTDIVSFREWTDGRVTKIIRDADTTQSGTNEDFDGVSIPTGFSSTGAPLHLVTIKSFDAQGRRNSSTSPSGQVVPSYFSRLADHRAVVLKFADHVDTERFGPISYGVINQAGGGEAQGQIAMQGNSSTSLLTAYLDETDDDPITAVDVGTLSSLRTRIFDNAGSTLDESRGYHLIPSSGAGAESTNYDRTLLGYDDMGRRIRAKDSTDTIDRKTYDKLGRLTATYVGTNDSSFSGGEPSGEDNMVMVLEREYDEGDDGGNSLLTKSTEYVEELDTDKRETTYTYDHRGRVRMVTNPAAPHSLHKHDNLGRILATALYGSTSNIIPGTTDPDSTGMQTDRTALMTTHYDERGRIWKGVRYNIDFSDGSDDDTLEILTWYDDAGRQIKMDGPQLSKITYDRLGRATHEYVLAVDNDTSYDHVTDVTGDIVLEETQLLYDSSEGHIVMSARIDRHHDDYGSGETVGALDSNADLEREEYTASDIEGRIQITAYWYDDLGRMVDSVSYGNNGDSDLDWATISGAPPARSDTTLRVTRAYNDSGRLESVTDPKGIASYFEYDAAGRRTKEVRNFNENINQGDPSVRVRSRHGDCRLSLRSAPG